MNVLSEDSYKALFDILDLRVKGGLGVDKAQLRFIQFSILNNSFTFFYDNFGSKSGYAVWANISIETFNRFERSGKFPRYFYEWSEGEICLVLDIYIGGRRLGSNVSSILRLIKKNKILTYFRNGKVYRYIGSRG